LSVDHCLSTIVNIDPSLKRMANKENNKNLEEAFALVIKELRLKKNLSQQDLSFESELDRTYISLLERGKRQPSLRTILALAQALDTTGPELVKRTVQALAK